jgi:hypothetical protein
MVRAAAKNFASVGVVVSPSRYAGVVDAIRAEGGLSLELRRDLAVEKIHDELAGRRRPRVARSPHPARQDLDHLESARRAPGTDRRIAVDLAPGRGSSCSSPGGVFSSASEPFPVAPTRRPSCVHEAADYRGDPPPHERERATR